MYRIELSRAARKDLDSLQKDTVARLGEWFKRLAADPQPFGSTKLRAFQGEYRIRVGDHRVRYSIDDKERIVNILSIKHRGDAYR